jgi:hypothetical protein
MNVGGDYLCYGVELHRYNICRKVHLTQQSMSRKCGVKILGKPAGHYCWSVIMAAWEFRSSNRSGFDWDFGSSNRSGFDWECGPSNRSGCDWEFGSSNRSGFDCRSSL